MVANANCYYRINDNLTWNNISISVTGSSMQASIPSQPNGTIIAYYISLTDIYGYESGILPIAANLTPIKNANLPYFILVGYELLVEEDSTNKQMTE